MAAVRDNTGGLGKRVPWVVGSFSFKVQQAKLAFDCVYSAIEHPGADLSCL